MSEAMPAAGRAWPIIDLTEPIGRAEAPAASVPKMVLIVPISAASPALVAVPWASMIADRGRIDAGVAIGGAKRFDLAGGGGSEQASFAAIAAAANTFDDGIDLVAVAEGIGQAFEHDCASSFGEDNAIGTAIEGPDFAGRRDGVEPGENRPEAGVLIQRDAAGHAQIAQAEPQPVHQLLDRDERRSAGRVDRVGGSTQVEPIGGAAGGEVGNRGRNIVGVVAGQIAAQLAMDRLDFSGPNSGNRAASRSWTQGMTSVFMATSSCRLVQCPPRPMTRSVRRRTEASSGTRASARASSTTCKIKN